MIDKQSQRLKLGTGVGEKETSEKAGGVGGGFKGENGGSHGPEWVRETCIWNKRILSLVYSLTLTLCYCGLDDADYCSIFSH